MPDSTPDIAAHDARSIRCPRLGHDVPFSYCRAPASDTPCPGMLGCWANALDVEAYLREHYGEAVIEKLRQPRPDKVVTLVELIEQAKRRCGNTEG